MKLGMFMMPMHPPGRPLEATLQEDLECARLLDRVGFDELWVGEHYSCSTEPISGPLIFMAALVPETKRIKLCSGVLNLPQHHPAVVASHAAMFDHIAKGRFIMGIGPGGLPSDFELFGTEDAPRRVAMAQEAIDIILELWAKDPPYDIQGRFWTIKLSEQVVPALGLGLMTKPFQKPHPPIAMSAMSPSSNSIRTAAKRGWSAVSAGFIPVESNLKTHWQKLVEGFEEAGAEPDGDKWRVVRNILVADTDAAAEAHLRRPGNSIHFFYDYIFQVVSRFDSTHLLKEDRNQPDSEVTTDQLVRSNVIAGSPDTVAARILELRERVGPFGTIVMQAFDWDDAAVQRRSIELMATEVMPRINRSLAPAIAAK